MYEKLNSLPTRSQAGPSDLKQRGRLRCRRKSDGQSFAWVRLACLTWCLVRDSERLTASKSVPPHAIFVTKSPLPAVSLTRPPSY